MFGNPEYHNSFRPDRNTSSTMPYSSTISLSDEESSTQLWQMYNRAKLYLPSQQRMENLAWRMMAYNLKKLKRSNQNPDLSVESYAYNNAPSSSSNNNSQRNSSETKAPQKNFTPRNSFLDNTLRRQNSANKSTSRARNPISGDNIINSHSDDSMLDDRTSEDRSWYDLQNSNVQQNITPYSNPSYDNHSALQNIEESSSHSNLTLTLEDEISKMSYPIDESSGRFNNISSSFDAYKNFDSKPQPDSNLHSYTESNLDSIESRKSGIISSPCSNRSTTRPGFDSSKLSSSKDHNKVEFDYLAHIKKLSQEVHYSDNSASVSEASDSPGFGSPSFSFAKSDQYQAPKITATSSIRSALSRASSNNSGADKFGKPNLDVRSQNTINKSNSRGFQLSMDPRDIESFDISSGPRSLNVTDGSNNSMLIDSPPSVSGSFSSNVSSSFDSYNKPSGHGISSSMTSGEDFLSSPNPSLSGSISNSTTPNFFGGAKDSFYFDTISNPKDRPNGISSRGSFAGSSMSRNSSTNGNHNVGHNINGINGPAFSEPFPTNLQDMGLDTSENLSSSWQSAQSMPLNNHHSSLSLAQYADMLVSSEDAIISSPSADIYNSISDLRSSQYKGSLNEEGVTARGNVDSSIFGNNGMFSLGEDNLNIKSVYRTSAPSFSFVDEPDHENEQSHEPEAPFFDPNGINFQKSNMVNQKSNMVNRMSNGASSAPGAQMQQFSRANSSTNFYPSNSNGSYLSSSLRRVDTSPSLSIQRSASAINMKNMVSENKFDVMSNCKPRKRNSVTFSKPAVTPEANISSSLPTTSSVNITQIFCSNCYTRTTPLWRKDPDGQPLCNACGLFLKLHGVVRPLSLKTDVIKKRNRSGQVGVSGSASTSTTSSPIEGSGGVVVNSKGSSNSFKVSETLGSSIPLNLSGNKGRRGSSAVGEIPPGFKSRRASNSSRQRPARPVKNDSKETIKTSYKKPGGVPKSSFAVDSGHSSRASSSEPMGTISDKPHPSQNHESQNFSGSNSIGGSQWEWLTTSI